jgi:2-polyprenyl-6-methoxyphenol hydroxylase-like FAD-dependent oxidoreductase
MTEKILAEGLAEARGAVRWGCTVEALVEKLEGVQASLVSSEGRQTIHARYVIGADGMHSLVRQTAGIGFTGGSYEESFVLSDVEMTWDHGRDEVMLFFSPAGLLVVAPLPTGTYRIVATLDNAPEQPGIADVQALLEAQGPTHQLPECCKYTGVRASVCTTVWRTSTAAGVSCHWAMPRMCTVRQGVRE